jgi:hypothetical protein
MDWTLLFLIIAAAGIGVLLAWQLRRGRGRERRNDAARLAAGEAGVDAPTPPQAQTSWAPPQYETPARPDGPSLKVGLGVVRNTGQGLLVSWNAINDGTLPLRVGWGAPQLEWLGGDGLRIGYSLGSGEPSGNAGAVRVCQPGEILSRSSALTAEALARDPARLRLSVMVGYAPAGEDSMGDTRQAVSPPRVVPAA